MAEPTITTSPIGGNNPMLPVLFTTPAEYDTDAQALEALIALEDEFRAFRVQVQSQMRAYHNALSSVTGPLYKRVFHRLVDDDRMGLPNEAMFQGWHAPSCRAEDDLRGALEEMLFAFWQAKTYAKAMQRNREVRS